MAVNGGMAMDHPAGLSRPADKMLKQVTWPVLSGEMPPLAGSFEPRPETGFSAAAGLPGRAVPVGEFSAREAVNYLATRLARESDQRTGVVDLVSALGGLPLALAQAASVIIDSGISCADYQLRFADRRRQASAAGPAVTGGGPTTADGGSAATGGEPAAGRPVTGDQPPVSGGEPMGTEGEPMATVSA